MGAATAAKQLEKLTKETAKTEADAAKAETELEAKRQEHKVCLPTPVSDLASKSGLHGAFVNGRVCDFRLCEYKFVHGSSCNRMPIEQGIAGH